MLWGLEDSPLRILPRSQLHRMRMAWEAEAVQLEYLLKLPAEKLQWVPGVGSARAPIVYEALYFHRIDEEFQKELARRAAPAPHVSESQGETH